MFNYILTSLVSHALVLAMLMTLPLERMDKSSQNVFDVDIVSPEPGLQPLKPETMPAPKELPPSPPARTESDDTLPPETIFGQGSHSAKKPVQKADPLPEPLIIPPPAPERTRDAQHDEMAIGDSEPERDTVPGEPLEPGSPDKGPGRAPSTLPRGGLFDDEIINKYARKSIPDEKGKDLRFDAPDFRNRGYMKMLRERIERIWKYPPDAARKGIAGDLYIKFSIRKDGSIGETTLIRTSGYKDLDEAALKAIRDGEPYWPLPENWKGEKLEITGHFIYLSGRSFIL